MALNSVRHETVVNPDEGVYVEIEGVMEVNFGLSQMRSNFKVSLRCATPLMTQTSIAPLRTSRTSKRDSGVIISSKGGQIIIT